MRRLLPLAVLLIAFFAYSPAMVGADGAPVATCSDPATSIKLTLVSMTPNTQPSISNSCDKYMGGRDNQTVFQKVIITCGGTQVILTVSVVGSMPKLFVDPGFTFSGTCLPRGDQYAFATSSVLCDGLTLDVSFEAQTQIADDQPIPFGAFCFLLKDQGGIPKG